MIIETKTLENWRIRIRNAQSDIFFELKTMVNQFTKDEKLKQIVNQSYYTINHKRFVIGLDGRPVYGVVENYQPEKRNDIVKQVISYLLKTEGGNETWFDLAALSTTYFKVANRINNIVSLEKLMERHQLAQEAVNFARDRRDVFRFTE